MAVKPWYDVISWHCPVCGIGDLIIEDGRCYNCGVYLDWSEVCEKNDG